MLKKNIFLLISIVANLFVFTSCSEELILKKSTSKSIINFTFSQFNPAIDATINEADKKISATVPFSADITKLKPNIVVSLGAKVFPASGEEKDFTKDVIYTVTAQDASQIDYKVTVSRAKSSAKEILTFSFNDFNPVVIATIDQTTKAITATLPSTADLTKINPTISISERANISPLAGVTTDFSKAVNFTVKAEDGSTQVYVVTLTKEKPPVNAVTIKSGKNPSTNVLYVIGGSTLYALDASTGSEIWNYYNNGTILFANSTLYDGNIVLVSQGVKFINASTGVLNGEIKESTTSYSSPVIVNDVLYYGTGGGGLLKAFNLKTKSEKWSTSVEYRAQSSPTVYKGNVFMAVQNGNSFNAYDAETGVLKWRTYPTFNPMSGFINACTFENLVITSGSYSFKALDINTGDVKWKFEGCKGTNSSPTESEGVIYFGDVNTNIYALNAATGTMKWKYKTDNEIDSSPIVYQDMVYVYSKDSFIYALDKKTGELIWKVQIGKTSDYSLSYIDSSPVVFEGVLYLMGQDGSTYALNAKTGKELWQFTKSYYQTISSPFVIDKSGKVYNAGISGMTN